jgi:hypothetical protein
MIKKLFVILFFFTASFAFSQNVQKYIHNGDELLKNKQYYSAANQYKKALDLAYDDNLAYKYAEANRLDYNYKEAEKYYKKVAVESADKFDMLFFNLGLVQKGLEKYLQAKRSFNRFLNVYQTDDYYKKRALHENISCQKAFEMKFKKNNIKINHCDSIVNSDWGELMLYEKDSNNLYFTALRPDTSKSEEHVLKASIYYLDKRNPVKDSVFFTSVFDENQDYNIANFCFNSAKTYMFFTKCKIDLNKQKCNIWKAKINGDSITDISKLSSAVNFPASNSIQPSISLVDDREIMFFASNRKGGYGRYDIWYSEVYEDGSVSSAKNLGENINSIDNEITPYYDSKKGIIYFSSEWYNNLGGFDIFKANGNLDYWSEPQNMEPPLNSSYNDYYYRLNDEHNRAYFSSNREEAYTEKEGNCCTDIFKIDIPKEEEVIIVDVPEIEEDMEELIPITLYFHNDEPNPKTRDTTTEFSYDETYQKYIEMLDEYEKEFSFGLKKDKKEEAVNAIDNFFSEKVEKGYGKLLEFNFLLQQVLEENEKVVITIKGFASPLNSNDYNVNLSKRRIQSLVNYYQNAEDGYFQKYINSGQLSFVREAFGEDTADFNISDDYSDVKNSIYNPAAANERKIKVIAVAFK